MTNDIIRHLFAQWYSLYPLIHLDWCSSRSSISKDVGQVVCVESTRDSESTTHFAWQKSYRSRVEWETLGVFACQRCMRGDQTFPLYLCRHCHEGVCPQCAEPFRNFFEGSFKCGRCEDSIGKSSSSGDAAAPPLSATAAVSRPPPWRRCSVDASKKRPRDPSRQQEPSSSAVPKKMPRPRGSVALELSCASSPM